MDREFELGAVGGRNLNKKKKLCQLVAMHHLGALALSIPSERSQSFTISSLVYNTLNCFNHSC